MNRHGWPRPSYQKNAPVDVLTHDTWMAQTAMHEAVQVPLKASSLCEQKRTLMGAREGIISRLETYQRNKDHGPDIWS